MCLLIHYSCESFYDIKDGRTPRITSIAVRNFKSGQTYSFSIHKSAELKKLNIEDITDRYDELERDMLEEFYDFVKTKVDYIFFHWNMRDINFGFQAIEHRFRILEGAPTVVSEANKVDLARLLVAIYGKGYAPHGDGGRLHSLIEMNRITDRDALKGVEEARAFEDAEYVKLHQSTLRKVDVMANILDRALDGSLKTNSTWREMHGFHPSVVVEYVTQHWIFVLLSAFAVVISVVGFF